MKFLLSLVLLAALATAADPKATIASLNARLAAEERTSSELRKELATARQATGERIEAARSGLESKIADLQNRLDMARQAETAARAIADSKDETIRQLQRQADTLQSHAADTLKVATIARTAVNDAVKSATTRHAADVAELKTTSFLASSAADSAATAAQLGEANKKTLDDSRKQIKTLTATLDTVKTSQTKERRLTVVVACCTFGVLALLVVRRHARRRHGPTTAGP